MQGDLTPSKLDKHMKRKGLNAKENGEEGHVKKVVDKSRPNSGAYSFPRATVSDMKPVLVQILWFPPSLYFSDSRVSFLKIQSIFPVSSWKIIVAIYETFLHITLMCYGP